MDNNRETYTVTLEFTVDNAGDHTGSGVTYKILE
jgi:hypothetical protein